MKKTIMVVDDIATNLTAAEDALGDDYRVIALTSAAQMFKALDRFETDIILLDIDMPEMDGFEAMALLKKRSHASIPVIFLTALSDHNLEARGIEMGAADFIMKPFSRSVLINRIKHHLDVDSLIRERTRQLIEQARLMEQLQHGIIHTISDVIERRDHNTGGHVERTASLIRKLIDGMEASGLYAETIREWNREAIMLSSRLHDVGKIVIPDAILNKPGKLTPEEFAIMKTHTTEGQQVIDQIIGRTGEGAFLHEAKLFAAYHHERWDGNGYPYGLENSSIPLQGRIMAVIDVYDALVSERPYKPAFTQTQALGIIRDESGRHFDPRIAQLFVKLHS